MDPSLQLLMGSFVGNVQISACLGDECSGLIGVPLIIEIIKHIWGLQMKGMFNCVFLTEGVLMVLFLP